MFKSYTAKLQQSWECADVPVLAKKQQAKDFNRMFPVFGEKPVFTHLENILAPQKAGNGADQEVTEADVYEDNSGTALVVNINNCLIIGSDTRHSADYNINSRNMTRIFRVGDFFMTTTGFYADSFEVYTKMNYEIRQYATYGPISLKAAAHLLHNILYARRFFPYYTYICLSGVEDGVAGIYSFDSIGSYELVNCRCDGSASKMIQPLLDSWISGKNFEGFSMPDFDTATRLVKKAFDSAAERDVRTKDTLELYLVQGCEVRHEFVPLRRD